MRKDTESEKNGEERWGGETRGEIRQRVKIYETKANNKPTLLDCN